MLSPARAVIDEKSERAMATTFCRSPKTEKWMPKDRSLMSKTTRRRKDATRHPACKRVSRAGPHNLARVWGPVMLINHASAPQAGAARALPRWAVWRSRCCALHFSATARPTTWWTSPRCRSRLVRKAWGDVAATVCPHRGQRHRLEEGPPRPQHLFPYRPRGLAEAQLTAMSAALLAPR